MLSAQLHTFCIALHKRVRSCLFCFLGSPTPKRHEMTTPNHTSIPSSKTNETTVQQKKEDNALSPLQIVGITVFALAVAVLLVVIAAVVVVVCRRKKRVVQSVQSESMVDPHPSLMALAGDRAGSLDLAALRAETEKVLRDGDSSVAEDLVHRHIGDDNAEWVADVVRGGLRYVNGCRYPRMEIRRDSQLTLMDVFPTKQDCLHMTKLSDYLGNTVLISQAPKRVQFNYHWRAIWQEKVGVVLWMGNMAEGALKLMDNYIELFAGDQAVFGPFRVITASTPRRLPEYDEYRVTVRLGNEERQLVFINEHVWPMYGARANPRAVADLVHHVRAHQLDQAKARLPGLLVHGSTGIERSPAFVSVYIGYQMWLSDRKVNLTGIMRYVRRQRWQSFTRPTTLNHVRTAFAAMLELAQTASERRAEGDQKLEAMEALSDRSCQRRVEETGRATG